MPAKTKAEFGKGLSQEVNHDDSSPNPPGLYRHPETGAEMIAYPNSKIGAAQADGLKRVGFEYVGPADFGKLRQSQKQQEGPLSKEADAELKRVQSENAKLVEQVKEKEAQLAELATSSSEKVEVKDEGTSESHGPDEEEVPDPTKGKSRTELDEWAKQLGLDPANYKNRDHLAEAINETLESQKEN